MNVDNWSNLESCPLFVVLLDAVYAFKEAFNTSSSKFALSIAVPFHTPVAIVPSVVIELAPVNPVLSADCNTTCAEPDTTPTPPNNASSVIAPPRETEVPLIVIAEFANLSFAIEPANLSLDIEPANCAFVIPDTCAEPENTPSPFATNTLDSEPLAPAIHWLVVPFHNNEPLAGPFVSCISKPPSAAPLPLRAKMLSPNTIVVESTDVVVPCTSKLPTTVKSFPIVTSSGKLIVTLTSLPTLVTAVEISFAVPKNCKSSANRSTSCVAPSSSSIVKLVANPVNPEPSPTNEPVIVEVPAISPIDAPLILPLPKSVAWLESKETTCAEPVTTPTPPNNASSVIAPPNDTEVPLIVIDELVSDEFPILDIVLSPPLIVLLVKVTADAANEPV